MAELVKTFGGLTWGSVNSFGGLARASIKSFNGIDTTPSGGFVPTDIAGCNLWLDASQIVGLSDGDPVATWDDESGSGNDATQGSGGSQPTYQTGELNSLPVVQCDGYDDFLTVGATDYTTFGTLFTVAKGGVNRAYGFQGGRSRPTNNPTWNFYQSSNFVEDLGGSTSVFAIQTHRFIATNDYTFSYNGGTPVSYIPVGGLGTAFQLGANGNSAECGSLVIAEAIGYNSVLSGGDISTVEAYLAAKYAL